MACENCSCNSNNTDTAFEVNMQEVNMQKELQDRFTRERCIELSIKWLHTGDEDTDDYSCRDMLNVARRINTFITTGNLVD